MVWMMSITDLSLTSYLVLGLLAREGPSTPYDLKRHVAATLGHFWSFPHALLYTEPPRLVALCLLTETAELHGRRRRIFSVTTAGLEALRAWLGRPSQEPTELRDAGLLQLFFADLGSPQAARSIATEQLAQHLVRLSAYEAEERREDDVTLPRGGGQTVAHWRGRTLRMGLLYERAAVEFWSGVLADEDLAEEATDRARAQDDGARIRA